MSTPRDISVTIGVRRPDDSISWFEFSVDEFTSLIDENDIHTINFANVADWHAVE